MAIENWTARFADALGEIDRHDTDPAEKLVAYANLYLDVLRDHVRTGLA